MSNVLNEPSIGSSATSPAASQLDSIQLSTGKVWIVLPAYNEEAAIQTLIKKITRVCVKDQLRYEIVVVDDASTDRTAEFVSGLTFESPVNLVQHEVNQGLAGAIRTGFNHFLDHGESGDVLVTLDADDTQPPAAIPMMLTKIDEGYDVVISSRYQNGSRTVGVPANRLAMTWFAKWLFKTITPIPGVWDYTCGFRAYRFDALCEAANYHGDNFVSEEGFSCMVDVLLKMRPLKPIMGEVPMLLRYDQKEGPSKMKVAKTATQTLQLLVKRRLGNFTS